MNAASAPLRGVAAVVIGRNEGPRLRRCLQSLSLTIARVVYVDSGSTDGSVTLARSLGAEVVELDGRQRFTAARARNAGMDRLLQIEPKVRFVLFIDGDCELCIGFPARALATLEHDPRLAVVCGRRRERFPQASVYNLLCDIEWDTPVGDAHACGGDAMMRVEAFRAVGGFNARLIAGEEPELCVRLRAAGYRVHRLDAEMTWHDATMTRFSQWWRRNVRAGHAYAQGAAMHGASPARHWVHERTSILLWGVALPLIILAAAYPTGGASLVLSLGYAVLLWRVHRAMRRRGLSPRASVLYALFCVLGKFPQAQGLIAFHRQRLARRDAVLIEYK